MKSLAFLILFLIFASVLAQPVPDILWNRTYECSEYCAAMDIAPCATGYVMVGDIWPDNQQIMDILAVRIAENGDTLWSREWEGIGNDKGRRIRQTPDGGFLIAGIYNRGPQAAVWLIRTDANGDTLWTRRLDGFYWVLVEDMEITFDGGCIVVGSAANGPQWNWQIAAIRFDANGDTLWSRCFGTDGQWYGKAVINMPDSGFAIAGYYDPDTIATRGCLVRLNMQGDPIWTRTYYGDDELADLALAANGGFVIAGHWRMDSTSDWNLFVSWTNSAGYEQLSFAYGSEQDEMTKALLLLPDNNCVVLAQSGSINGVGRDFMLLKVSNQAALQWERTYNSGGDEFPQALIRTEDECYLMAGGRDVTHTGWYAFCAIKTGYDPLPVEQGQAIRPTTFSLAVFPNPFNPSTEIIYHLRNAGQVSLRVYNLIGREVTVLAEGFAEAGTHQVMFDGSELPSGIYVCRLQAGDHVENRKLFLIR
jgi:hypothetical protein